MPAEAEPLPAFASRIHLPTVLVRIVMRFRTPARDRATAASGPESVADSSSTGGLTRYLFVAAGILVLAYAVSRLFDSRDAIPAVDEIQDRAAETVPDEVQNRAVDAVPDHRIETIRNRTSQTVPDDITEISIEGPRSEASESEPDLDSPTGPAGGGDESDVTGLNESGDELDDSEVESDGKGDDESAE